VESCFGYLACRFPLSSYCCCYSIIKQPSRQGKFDKAKGSAHNVAGDIKDALKDVTE
jgi:hypothetical protein